LTITMTFIIDSFLCWARLAPVDNSCKRRVSVQIDTFDQ
jgi:hypothetical protein